LDKIKVRNHVEYLVRWLHYPIEESCWVPYRKGDASWQADLYHVLDFELEREKQRTARSATSKGQGNKKRNNVDKTRNNNTQSGNQIKVIVVKRKPSESLGGVSEDRVLRLPDMVPLVSPV
jgi:hypothetical protein